MVSTQKQFATKNSSRLTEWLTKPQEKKRTHDTDLEETLELSEKEHVAEQHRIYQEARKSSKGKQPMHGRPFPLPTPKAPNTDDEDEDIFQTVSTRPPHIKNEKKQKRKTTTKNSQPVEKDNQPVKKEKEDKEEQFIIDDVSEWLGLKKEKQDQEQVLEIENVSSWLQQDDPVMTAKTEKQDEQEKTLEIDDVSAWLEEDNDEMNQDAVSSLMFLIHICVYSQ
jgi:hypothetical protein